MTIDFPGFSVVYPIRDKETFLPPLAEGQGLFLQALNDEQHFTEPPARFTEASLVKELEANGIGRPSTYAAILEIIQQRGYVYQDDKRKLRPTDLGFAVTDKLVQHFPDVMEVQFTASIEQELDEVEEGKVVWDERGAGFLRPVLVGPGSGRRTAMDFIRLPGQTDRRGLRRVRQADGAAHRPHRAVPGLQRLSGVQGTRSRCPEAAAGRRREQTCELCGKPMVMRSAAASARSWAAPAIRSARIPFACAAASRCRVTCEPITARKGPATAAAGSRSRTTATVREMRQADGPAQRQLRHIPGMFRLSEVQEHPAAREGRGIHRPTPTRPKAETSEGPQQLCEKCGKPMVMKKGR